MEIDTPLLNHNRLKTKGTGIPTNMGLDHLGIVVPNAQQAADFLMEVFDAELDWEIKREPNPTAGERGWSSIFGVHPDSYLAHVIMLKCGENPLTQYVEIFEWNSPDQNKPLGAWHKMSDIGNSYISFTVKDINKVVAHIKENVIPKWQGTRFIQDPPMDFPLRGEVCTSTFLVSPWGMWIELTCWSQSKNLGQVIKAQRQDEPHHLIGCSIDTLPTPSFLIDLDNLDHNIKQMRSRIGSAGINWLVTCKAHKCPDLAKYILERGGGQGVLLLTVTEAEQFAAAGINDIYLANEVACFDELKRISLLAKKIKRLRVAVDNEVYLEELAAAVKQWEITTPIEVLVELNVNHNRCGVDIDEALKLAKRVRQIELESKALIFAGITGYEGHIAILPPEEKKHQTILSHGILEEAKKRIEEIGIDVKIISGGGSCNYIDCIETGILTEIQAGGGAICDILYFEKANLKEHGHKISSFVLTQIISMPKDKSRAIGNAGFKALGWHPFGGLPKTRDKKTLKIIGLSAEHTKFEILPSNANDENVSNLNDSIKRGDKIMLIPGYTDAMGFLHRRIYGIRGDVVETVWDTVSEKTW